MMWDILPQYFTIPQIGMHFVTILDPCISAGEPRGEYPPFDLVCRNSFLNISQYLLSVLKGDELNIWVMDSDGEPLVAKVEGWINI